jgi:hypothetical protein
MKRLFVFGLLIVCGLVALASEEGFTPLFDGATLDGWQGGKEGYVVKEGSIVSQPQGSRNLATIKEYGDFHLKFEFKLTPGANNGIGIRVPDEVEGKRLDPAHDAIEIQIIDDAHERYASIKDWQRHGSVYGIVAAKTGHLKPAGEWNSEEIIARGKHIQVILNGQTIVDADIEKAVQNGTLDGKAHVGAKRDRGHICFCGHGAEVWFRNLRIKEL